MTPEQKTRADVINMRCLSLCIGMLERVNGVRVPHGLLVVISFMKLMVVFSDSRKTPH